MLPTVKASSSTLQGGSKALFPNPARESYSPLGQQTQCEYKEQSGLKSVFGVVICPRSKERG